MAAVLASFVGETSVLGRLQTGNVRLTASLRTREDLLRNGTVALIILVVFDDIEMIFQTHNELTVDADQRLVRETHAGCQRRKGFSSRDTSTLAHQVRYRIRSTHVFRLA